MAVAPNIFDVPAAKKETDYSDEIVGAFKVGYQDARGNPQSLEHWLVRTDDPDVAEEIAALMGGEPEDTGADKLPIGVFTTTATVKILVAPNGIRSGFALWGNRSLVSRCDGQVIVWSKDDPAEVGQRCACADRTPEQRRSAAKKGTGCKPDVSVLFSLAELPNLGKFRMQSGSEILLKDIQGVEARVAEAEEPVKLTLSIERVTTKAGFTFSKVTVA